MINYNFINYNDIVNFNKDCFNKILIDISEQKESISSIIDKTMTIFRIIDYYDIPEKGLIVSGIVQNNKIKLIYRPSQQAKPIYLFIHTLIIGT